jgi:hypothetical protein
MDPISGSPALVHRKAKETLKDVGGFAAGGLFNLKAMSGAHDR